MVNEQIPETLIPPLTTRLARNYRSNLTRRERERERSAMTARYRIEERERLGRKFVWRGLNYARGNERRRREDEARQAGNRPYRSGEIEKVEMGSGDRDISREIVRAYLFSGERRVSRSDCGPRYREYK